MHDKPTLITKRKGWLAFSMFLGGILFTTVAILLMQKELYAEHLSIRNLILSIVFLLLAIALFRGFYIELSVHVLYKDRLEIRSVFGRSRKILFAEINGWWESKHDTRYGKYEILTLYTNSSKILVSSQYNDSYQLIKSYATKDKPLKNGRKK